MLRLGYFISLGLAALSAAAIDYAVVAALCVVGVRSVRLLHELCIDAVGRNYLAQFSGTATPVGPYKLTGRVWEMA